LYRNGKILLIQLHSPVSDEKVWMPPGGAVRFGEPVKEALKREFYEETGLDIEVGKLLFINELIERKFHAIELYFQVFNEKDEPLLGYDPEHDKGEQILKEIRFFDSGELKKVHTAPPWIQTNFRDMINENSTELGFSWAN